MKIAIPTEDGFTILQEMAPVKGFLVSTIQFGEVVQQEMRWVSPNESAKNGYSKTIEDCDKVIVREIDLEQTNYLQLHNKEVVKTEESIITKVLMHYLPELLRKESNTCCCP